MMVSAKDKNQAGKGKELLGMGGMICPFTYDGVNTIDQSNLTQRVWRLSERQAFLTCVCVCACVCGVWGKCK